MKAWRLKLEAMAWLRFGKRMPIVCTEVGNWKCDVLGVSPTMSVEVETKISKSDLRADFTGKRSKHFSYGLNGAMVPNHFYFMVPKSLGPFAVEYCQEKNPKIGVLAVPDDGTHFGNCEVLRRSQKLHDNPPSNRMIHTAQLRCSSELYRLTEFVGQMKGVDKESPEFLNAYEAAAKAAFRDCGHLDIEDVQGSLEIRAAELAFAVDGVEWSSLDEAQKDRWVKAAERYAGVKENAFEKWPNFKFL